MDGGVLPEPKTAQAERRKRMKKLPPIRRQTRIGGRFVYVIHLVITCVSKQGKCIYICLLTQAGRVRPHSAFLHFSKQGKLHELLKKMSFVCLLPRAKTC